MMSYNIGQPINKGILPTNSFANSTFQQDINGQMYSHTPQGSPQARMLYQGIDSKQLPSIMYNQMAVSVPGYQLPGMVYPPNMYPRGYYYPQPAITAPSMGNGYYGPVVPNGTKFVRSPQRETPVVPYVSTQYAQSPNNYQHLLPKNEEIKLDKESPVTSEKHKLGQIDYSSLVSYTNSPSLKRRRRARQKISDPDQTYPCTECGKVFQKPYNLKSHMKTHSNEKPFKCGKCDKTFARSHDKKRHEILHGGEKNFKCEGYLKDGVTKWGCGKKFARSDALSRHFRTETGWLCIRPLMDEAKRAENDHEHPTTSDTPDFDLVDNSIVRRLIHGKL